MLGVKKHEKKTREFYSLSPYPFLFYFSCLFSRASFHQVFSKNKSKSSQLKIILSQINKVAVVTIALSEQGDDECFKFGGQHCRMQGNTWWTIGTTGQYKINTLS